MEIELENQEKATFVPLVDRAIGFSLALVHFYKDIQADSVGRIIGRQLLRSGTSIGANVAEAHGGQSKADFITKLSIAHKESRETEYWLMVLKKSNIGMKQNVEELSAEAAQFTRILSASILTAKASIKTKKSKSSA